MSQAELNRIGGRCKVLFIGVKPFIKRDLTPLLAPYLPLSAAIDLPLSATRADLSSFCQTDLPKFCFVEIDKADDPALDMFPELLRHDPKLGIIALLPAGNPDLILRCLRLGASDFLIAPFTGEQVQSALQKLIKLLPGRTPSAPGKIYSVIPVKGACGATTLACALAYQWKRLGSNRVLLADLDPLTGVVDFLLKVKSQFSFANVLHRASDMDPDLWNGMVAKRDGVDVLVAPETLPDGEVDFTDASPILDYARDHYDVTIADAGAAQGAWTLSQAALSDEVLLVTTNELLSLQAAQRALKYLESNGIGRWKIRLIVNRYERQVGLSEDLIASAIGMEATHVLPSDYAAIQKALLGGKPVPGSSSFGKSVAALADKLAGRVAAVRKPSSLAGLLSLFSRTSG